MPHYLFKSSTAFTASIEKHVRRTLEHGCHGWWVTDALATLTECAYSVAGGPPSRRGPTSTSYDYRQLTPIVTRQALRRAGTRAFESMLRVLVEMPARNAVAVVRLVTRWALSSWRRPPSATWPCSRRGW